MSELLLDTLPLYVRKTIFAQLRLLFSTPYFSHQDKEDLIQDFLVFYMEKFVASDEESDEAYIVTAFRNFTKNTIDKARIWHRCKADFGENFDEMAEQIRDTGQTLANFEAHRTVEQLFANLSGQERDICLMVMGGASLNEISRVKRMSKNTIYKIFEKISKL